jgi:hypothetical protein
VAHVNATTYQLRGQFDKLIREKNDLCLAHRSGDRTQAWMDVYYSHPSPKQALGLGKKIAKLEKTLPELHAALKPLLVRIMDCASEFERVDAAEKQAKADRKAAIASKKADKEAKRQNPYLGLNESVAKLLLEVAEPYRVKAVEMFTAQERRFIEIIRERFASNGGSFDPEKLWPTDRKTTAWEHAAAMQNRMEARRYICWVANNWQWKSGQDSIIAKYAEEKAEAMVNAFVQKVGAKLSGIVDRKGNLDTTEISGSLSDHWMTFTFKDGSRFQVQSQIVWKTSVNGVHFAQFPTCFRRVTLKDGSKLELPSESKMKEAFV